MVTSIDNIVSPDSKIDLDFINITPDHFAEYFKRNPGLLDSVININEDLFLELETGVDIHNIDNIWTLIIDEYKAPPLFNEPTVDISSCTKFIYNSIKDGLRCSLMRDWIDYVTKILINCATEFKNPSLSYVGSIAYDDVTFCFDVDGGILIFKLPLGLVKFKYDRCNSLGFKNLISNEDLRYIVDLSPIFSMTHISCDFKFNDIPKDNIFSGYMYEHPTFLLIDYYITSK